MAHQSTWSEAAVVGMREPDLLHGATLVAAVASEGLRREVFPERLTLQIRFLTGFVILVVVALCHSPACADHYALPADWQMSGFLAALNDSHSDTVAFSLNSHNATAMFHAMGHGPGTFQKHAREQVPALVELLSDRHPARVRKATALALGELGHHARQALPQLVGLLRERDDNVRRAAVRALSQLEQHAQEVVSQLVEILRGARPGPHVREAVADVLWRLEEHGEVALPEIIMLLRDESWRVRALAARALGRLGEHAGPAVKELAELVSDSEENVRRDVIRALRKLGEHATEAVPRLIELLRAQESEFYVRQYAAYALGMLGKPATEAVPDLLLLLDSHDEVEVRAAAMRSLAQLWVHAKEAAPELSTKLIGLLTSDEWEVRVAAINALVQLATYPSESVPWPAEKIVQMLRDNSRRVRDAAIFAIEGLGASVDEVVPELVKLLRDKAAESRARAAAAVSLGSLGGQAKAALPVLVKVIADSERLVRAAAVEALSSFEEHARAAVPELVNLLHHRESSVRVSASRAISELGEHAEEAIPELVGLLSHEEWHVRESAADALENLSRHVKARGAGLAPELNRLMRDRASQQSVRAAAANLLGELGPYAKQAVSDLVSLMEGRNWKLQAVAAESLGRLGEHARKVVPDLSNRLAKLLTHEDPSVRLRAVYALGELGEHARAEAPKLAGLLIDEDGETYDAVVEVLEAIGPFPVQIMPTILTHTFAYASRAGEIRFLAHFLGGGAEEVERLLVWLQVPAAKLVEEFGHRDDVSEALEVFKLIWDSAEGYDALRQDLGSKIAIMLTGDWAVGLETERIWFEEALRDAGLSIEASAVRQHIDTINRAGLVQWWGRRVGGVLVVHAVFWSLLIFVYPWSPQCQAFFFWNRWVRRLFGLGYVGCLLTWVPFLRRRLFAPFKHSLLADARLDSFDEKNYFRDSVVRMHDKTLCPIAEALPRILGQVVLEGESGLGKSMFLRQLVRRQEDLTVFLLAVDCKHGVEEAVQNKLEGPARDPEYIRKLVYAGTLHIVIDGLNEISPDTRARIVDFARRFSKGNLLMATQPMVWEPPSTAKVYRIQRLNEKQVEKFLISRFDTLSSDSGMTRDSYADRCRSHMRDALSDAQFTAMRDAMERVLSNPMDLTVVAELILKGEEPDPFKLQQQLFEIMLIDYNYQQAGEIPFPNKRFAESVYEKTKTEDTAVFAEGEFEVELTVMSVHKMVVEFHRAANGAKRFWTFRHDKIRDFFLVQTLLDDRNRRVKHFSDPRFHGVYMQLTYSMPLAEAETLERDLINHAAETGDHSASDDFIKLLCSIKAAQPPSDREHTG